MKKINKKATKGQWIVDKDDKDIQYLIKPFSIFNINKMPSEDLSQVNPSEYYIIFNHALQDWKGIVDDNDKPLACNEENKKLIYDYDQDLVSFVLEVAIKMRNEVLNKEAVKN